MSLAQRLRALADEVAALEARVSPPAPAPAPAPVPAPPPPAPFAGLRSQQLNPARLVTFADYWSDDVYHRFQRLTVWSGETARITIVGRTYQSGLLPRPFAASAYGLLLDGIEVASVTVTPGSNRADITVPLAGIAHGWHWLTLSSPDESTPMWPVYVDKGGPQPDQMPVTLGTFSLVHQRTFVHLWGMLPARWAPTVLPLAPREFPHDSTMLGRDKLVKTELVPWHNGDGYRPRATEKGLLHTAGYQAYFWHSVTDAMPQVALLDGPRGVGCVSMATHLQIGRGGNVYFCDPWRVGRISADGAVTTLAGYRHDAPPVLVTKGGTRVHLVGDWSAVPEKRRGFHELWGMAWDQRTLTTAGPAIVNDGNGKTEEPHDKAPVLFVADTQNNRVCRLEFDPRSHATPAKVTEFLTGLADPWDVVCGDGVLYVSERTANRINAYDATTGAFVRTVVSGATGLCTLHPQHRKAIRNPGVTLETVRAQPCQLPEGLYLLDGWLYFGSLAQQQVKRVNLETGVIEVVFTPTFDSNSNFVKIAVSDGTLFPRGRVLACTWAVINGGYPQGMSRGADSAGHGPGLPFEVLGYPTAVAVGDGRMACAAASEGVILVSKALPTDKPVTQARWRALEAAWQPYILSHGHGGFGHVGLPLPWGASPEIDEYLTLHGHKR